MADILIKACYFSYLVRAVFVKSREFSRHFENENLDLKFRKTDNKHASLQNYRCPEALELELGVKEVGRDPS